MAEVVADRIQGACRRFVVVVCATMSLKGSFSTTSSHGICEQCSGVHNPSLSILDLQFSTVRTGAEGGLPRKGMHYQWKKGPLLASCVRGMYLGV